MKPVYKNILAVLVGLIAGNVVNMLIVNLGYSILPLDGVDTDDLEALAAAIPDLEAKYFIFPFLAHAIGTLSGAFLTALIAASHKLKLAMVIGGFFLVAGIAVNYMITGPLWFSLLDILVAYIPMAYLGARWAISINKKATFEH